MQLIQDNEKNIYQNSVLVFDHESHFRGPRYSFDEESKDFRSPTRGHWNFKSKMAMNEIHAYCYIGNTKYKYILPLVSLALRSWLSMKSCLHLRLQQINLDSDSIYRTKKGKKKLKDSLQITILHNIRDSLEYRVPSIVGQN